MRERLVLAVCIVLITSSAACAEDAAKACMDQLAATETLVDQRVEAKALSEGEVEDVNMLLDEADAFCTEGKYDMASKTLADVNKMVAPGAEPTE